MRALSFFAVTLSLLLASVSAEAQIRVGASDPTPDSGPRLFDDELSSIDTEAGWATGLYVSGSVFTSLGAIATLLGAPMSGQVAGLGAVLMLGGLGSAALGIIQLGLAIGLDIDSGSRRAGVRRRASAWRLGVSPGGLSLSGAF